MIKINEMRCKRDGICVQECPLSIIKQTEKKAIPEMVSGGRNVCLLCGHCVAVCPHGAMSHDATPLDQSLPINKELVINKEQAVQFLRSRRSVRVYKNKTVEKEVIAELINLARYAPTGSNSQLVEWRVFTSEEDLKTISSMTVDWLREAVKNPPKEGIMPYIPLIVAAWDAGYDRILRDAPALIIASTPGDYRNGLVDLSIALSYLELVAVPMGLGTCWAGICRQAVDNYKPLQEFVGLSEDAQQYPMMLGYPKFRYHRLPERKVPKIIWKV